MKKFLQGTMFYIALIFVIMSLVFIQSNSTSKVEKIPFSEFYTSILEHKVSEVEIQDNGMIQGKMAGSDKVFTTYAGYLAKTDGLTKEILEQTQQGVLKSKVKEPTQTHWILDLLPMVMLILIIVAFWFIFVQQAQGGGSKVMGFGKSRAKLHKEDENIKITFNDVAGLQEEKEELKEIVDFLRSPQKYWNLGARIPKGILMVGPPGTGKTYLSKAVAGEAGVPFYSISGSDFVEMFVGVGASRVRDLFEQAKKTAPCIIFIDEIDAVGRKRGAGLGGGHDEREQTLNQLLVEMDGFRVNESIIVMAATNRPDILDPALLRPGRFDRQVMVGSPDVKGREEILKVHSRKKPLAEDVDLKVIARGTAGFTAADIENLMNEAALLTARNNGTKIKMQTIEEAIVKTIVGLAKKSRIITEDEKKLTAYHEAGHAILATVQKFCDPVHQVTIIPRGMAGGFTMSRPQEDRYYTTKQELKEKMVELLGGRVAEELILEDVSTGASNDLERVAKIARAMVTTYAMTDKLGAMAYGDSSDEVFLGKDFTTKPNYSEEVASQIDHEIKIIVDEAYATARKLLQENIDRLHNVAQALMVYETLDSEQFKKAFNGELDLNEDVEESISEGADTFFDGEKSDDAKVSDENSDISETPINGESGVVVDVTTSVDASEQK
ncbi:ATP-dependent metallopeptidase HflB [Filifactor alocis ATCC 35896]|uniref:ATP-dependent zinc metalloprotease FtsH n=1 Tax=Filifactor alocis (strain ATCC 35896 / CCUG 47790 / D40 B5) TaxID=546269 RepID=D6GSH1_FILAD|nr:ATP-dependent zinc metalloprotease FtsH [Filifactor alocis]EFE28612.1 ATP-dependent metallopeptidase HflB [Filifactor alocis ATCC 35896]